MSFSRLLGVIVFGIAICLCLMVCAIPRILTQKSPAADCHTTDENQTDLLNLCCSGNAILPAQTCFFPALHHEWPLRDEVFMVEANIAYVVGIELSDGLPISATRTILRI